MNDYGPVLALAVVILTAAGLALSFVRPWRRGVNTAEMATTLEDLQRAFIVEQQLRTDEREKYERAIAELRGQLHALTVTWAHDIATEIVRALRENGFDNPYHDRH